MLVYDFQRETTTTLFLFFFFLGGGRSREGRGPAFVVFKGHQHHHFRPQKKDRPTSRPGPHAPTPTPPHPTPTPPPRHFCRLPAWIRADLAQPPGQDTPKWPQNIPRRPQLSCSVTLEKKELEPFFWAWTILVFGSHQKNGKIIGATEQLSQTNQQRDFGFLFLVYL